MGKIVLIGFHFLLLSIPLFVYNFFELLFLKQLHAIVFFPATALLFLAIATYLLDLGFLRNFQKKHKAKVRFDPIANQKIAVGMTAYNDEGVIGKAVKDFVKAENVSKVIVIDNNCTDNTAAEAKEAGAIVVAEKVQGYGAACVRALKEAKKHGNIICLVEGDQTFAASDLKKLLAYIENCDLVVGTRTTAELAAKDSQLTWFMRYGNLFIAKLLQLRFWGTRFTDVGCTFRIIRPEALEKLLPHLKVNGNHFSPHMLLEAMKIGLKVIEVPVTLRKRAGTSKGVGSDIIKGLQTGLKMWIMILLS
jgi:glycosyltransferase involved in cell wall biosynthesis